MAPLPVEIMAGIYLGVLIGIIPALAAWGMGFLFKYFTGVTLPGFGVVVFAVALAGVNGGLLAILDPTITSSANATTVIVALIVVLMMSLYAHSRGDTMGATFPRRLSLKGLRERTLSTDVIDFVGGRGEATIHVAGEVADIEGYPPLSPDLRAEIGRGEWSFPADLRLAELEKRLADRLRTEYELGDVSVAINEKGRATVAAAPPFSGLSRRVGDGKRAVSVAAVLPTGLARGDEVRLETDDVAIGGTLVSAQTNGSPTKSAGDGADADPAPSAGPGDGPPIADGAGEDDAVPTPVNAPTTNGGEGRITVAVARTDAEPLVAADRARVVVESRGIRQEYELISLLRRAGRRFRKITVAAGGTLDGRTLADAAVRDTHDVAVMAVRTDDGWQLAPDGHITIDAGDELYAVGSRDALSGFQEAVA